MFAWKVFVLLFLVQLGCAHYQIVENPTDQCTARVNVPKYEKMGNKYYYIESKHQVNWHEANNICRRSGGYLTDINSAEEFHSLTIYLARHFINQRFWFAANDQAKEGDFVSLNTGQAMPFSRWQSGEPNNFGGNEDCATLKSTNLHEFTMYDENCKNKFNFICELKTHSIQMTTW